jgi:hypothetical protein
LVPGLFVVLIALAGCDHNTKIDERPGSDSPVTQVAPVPTRGPKVYLATPKGEVAVDVEVVSTEAKIERGLMYREHMAPDAGMLFILPEDKNWTFWMRNTLIPLDMIFIRKDLTIAGIVENAEPKTETLRQVNQISSYVLEVNGGWTRAHGVVKDAKVRLP